MEAGLSGVRAKTYRQRKLVFDTVPLDVTVTQLKRDNKIPQQKTHELNPSVIHCVQISPSYYRFLYLEVGRPYLWCERANLNDHELSTLIHDPTCKIYHMLVAGVPAGFFEIKDQGHKYFSLQYFGLVPQFVGKGLGPWLLNEAIGRMIHEGASNLYVETCNLDHPKALLTYQKAGFIPYKRLKKSLHVPKDYPSQRWQSMFEKSE